MNNRHMLNVIGIGNILRGDDGIGPDIIQRLKNKPLPVPLTLADVGSDAFSLLEYLIGKEPLLIIDCAKMGREPGTVQKFNLNENTVKSIDKTVSLHGMSLGEVYRMAGSLGAVANCTLIGVEPEQIEFGQPLSPAVEKQIPMIINLIIEEAKQYAR